ncbi:acyltransferase family protein, partial [Billgrantia bachuensis]
MPKPQYRPDIDGLRAIAVILVVAYHAGIPGFGFGFIGVDVFFVISGYLITSLLIRELEESGGISLLSFYGRRVRRLMPAMVVVLISSLVLGYVLLTPIGQQQSLAESALASIAFFANYYFIATTGGYFDGPTDQVPL